MPWYKEHDYPRMRDIFDDGYKLPSTYAKWLQNAEYKFNSLVSDGKTIIKINIDPDSFPKWCIERSLGINAQSRMDFVHFQMLKYANTH